MVDLVGSKTRRR
jgi:hypothetical protein